MLQTATITMAVVDAAPDLLVILGHEGLTKLTSSTAHSLLLKSSRYAADMQPASCGRLAMVQALSSLALVAARPASAGQS